MATDSADGAGAETVTALPERNWRPPRAGSALAALIVVVGCWLLADALGALDSLSIAAGGAAGMAVVVWLLGWDRYSMAGTLLGVTLAPLAGGLLFAGVGYALIAQLGGIVPQGTVFVALSIVLAAFGAASIPGDSADGEGVAAAAKSTMIAAVALIVVAGGFVGNAIRQAEEMEPFAALPALETVPSLFPEATMVPPFGVFLLLTSLALLALQGALTALPVAELLDDRSGDDDAVVAAFERLCWLLGWAKFGVVLGIVLVGARLVMGPAYAAIWTTVPGGLYGLLAWLSTSEGLRWLTVRVLVVSVCIVLAVRVLRRLHRAGISEHLGKFAVLAGIGTAFAAGWFGHELILNTVLGELERSLPGPVADLVLEQAGTVVDYYSGEVVALGLVAVGTATGAGALAFLRGGMLFGVVPRRHTATTLAGAGLLAAGGFAAALSVPASHALGVMVGAVVVWDIGRFGVGLGRDVGRRAPSLPVQFVRVLTAVLIGGVTAAAGLAAVSSTTSVSLATETTAALVLFVTLGVAFLASLVLAR
ncbi:hypothetical protein JCM30237_09040 [Halolamina litorea]|uniref:Uncharacterized protein n=1 Tax=Halolamina litorea TaxID=1515593 RepID=A0ABD6BRM0_9EURY|nr:hypothetical protein [Halolamina litorea]